MGPISILFILFLSFSLPPFLLSHFSLSLSLSLSDHGLKEVLVNIEQPQIKKPFLGGFYHKETGSEFHNASAQTIPRRRTGNEVIKEALYGCKMTFVLTGD